MNHLRHCNSIGYTIGKFNTVVKSDLGIHAGIVKSCKECENPLLVQG